jgi:hypothetical protein
MHVLGVSRYVDTETGASECKCGEMWNEVRGTVGRCRRLRSAQLTLGGRERWASAIIGHEGGQEPAIPLLGGSKAS